MKKLSGALYFFAMALTLLLWTDFVPKYLKQEAFVALEMYRDYKIVKGASINGMDGAQYYVAGDIGDESSQATLNLGFSEEFDVNSSFAVVNISTNRVVFAYDPKGSTDTWKTGGNISISGGQLLSYNSLTIGQTHSENSALADIAALDFNTSNINFITLNETSAVLTKSNTSKSVPSYNYVWHAEPDSRNEYFTNGLYGDVIDVSVNDAVYIAHDVRYLTENADFTGTAAKDGEEEYAAYYSNSIASTLEDEYGSNFAGPYIFATLPKTQNSSLEKVKTLMTHSAQDAYENQVLHITEKGIYSLSGTWNGQISIEADAVIILNGVDIECTVAPAIVFTDADSVTEYGDTNETSVAAASMDIGKNLLDDLTQQQANLVIIADGTTNNVTGSKIFPTKRNYIKWTELFILMSRWHFAAKQTALAF